MLIDTVKQGKFGVSVDGVDGVGKTTFIDIWREVWMDCTENPALIINPITHLFHTFVFDCFLSDYNKSKKIVDLFHSLIEGRETEKITLDNLLDYFRKQLNKDEYEGLVKDLFFYFNKEAILKAESYFFVYGPETLILFDRSFVSYDVYQCGDGEYSGRATDYDLNVILVADKEVVKKRLFDRKKDVDSNFSLERDEMNWKNYDLIDKRFREYGKHSPKTFYVDVSEEITKEFVLDVSDQISLTIFSKCADC